MFVHLNITVCIGVLLVGQCQNFQIYSEPSFCYRHIHVYLTERYAYSTFCEILRAYNNYIVKCLEELNFIYEMYEERGQTEWKCVYNSLATTLR